MLQGIICPTHYLHKFAIFSNYHLVLAHMIEGELSSGKYREFYGGLDSTHFKTLDNSSFEVGDDVYSEKELVSLARLVNANEIMAPESFEDGEETAHKILEFSSNMPDGISVFGTIHGKTVKEITKCFLDVYKSVSTIGFSCRLDFEGNGRFKEFLSNIKSGFSHFNKGVERAFKRVYVVNLIFDMIRDNRLDVSHLSFHLLGLNNPREILWYYNMIRSCDSSCAYISGKNKITLAESIEEYVKPKDKINFNDNCLGEIEIFRVVANISFISSLMRTKGV